MKANTMRAPLLKAGAVLLVFVLLAYLTSASPEGGVLDSLGLIIIGAFRLVQWAIAMIIGVTVCIAVLIGIFLFAVSLYDREASSELYAKTKASVAELLAPVFAFVDSLRTQGRTAAPAAAASPAVQPLIAEPAPAPAVAAVDTAKLQDELQTLITGEIRKVADSQQSLHDQFAVLHAKLGNIEEKAAGFAAADQVSAVAEEIAATGKRLDAVQASVASLEGRIDDTGRKLQDLTPDKILGDLPGRLAQIEQQGEAPVFDPQPLTESIQTLQKEMEELKKKGSGGKARKKA